MLYDDSTRLSWKNNSKNPEFLGVGRRVEVVIVIQTNAFAWNAIFWLPTMFKPICFFHLSYCAYDQVQEIRK
jgi:hypothetical protein